MARPWLSVIMPTYNGDAYLAAALDSVCAQDDAAIEVIAVDDGSTDATVPLLESYAERLPLRIVRRGRIGNWVANTNHGLTLARAEHVCFLHQDDLWLSGRLAVVKRLLAQSPDAALLLHPSWYIGPDGRRLGMWRCPLPAGPGELEAEFVVERLLVQNFISMPAPVFRRETALAVGGLDESLWFTADWDLWLKLAATGPALYHPEPLSAFRIHPQSQTAV
ncbi:MAG TPA: glycosyltransferase, partial [Gemmataceae bacterium]|nr:glycosyltransferase [Gemmataceae bacterium]